MGSKVANGQWLGKMKEAGLLRTERGPGENQHDSEGEGSYLRATVEKPSSNVGGKGMGEGAPQNVTGERR